MRKKKLKSIRATLNLEEDIALVTSLQTDDKVDHYFEIGLILITVLSASELQYASVRFSPLTELAEINFAFRILMMPTLILISTWLLKELLPVEPVKRMSLKRWAKEFCWALLGNILVLELIIFVTLSFRANIYQVIYIMYPIMFACFFLTLPVTWSYNKARTRKVNIEYFILFAFSYFLIYLTLQIASLPTP